MLDGLNAVDMLLGLGVWVPDSTCITKTERAGRTYDLYVIGHLLNLPGADLQVTQS